MRNGSPPRKAFLKALVERRRKAELLDGLGFEVYLLVKDTYTDLVGSDIYMEWHKWSVTEAVEAACEDALQDAMREQTGVTDNPDDWEDQSHRRFIIGQVHRHQGQRDAS